MASGNTLACFFPTDAEPPATNYATFDTRNNHPVLNFDTSTQETVYFTGILPRNYSSGGITVYVHWCAASATTGTIGWDSTFERIASGTMDIDADGFASAKTITAATVPSASGVPAISNVAHSNGAEIDSLQAGDSFRLRIRRDVSNDNASGDAQLIAVELKET